MSRIVFTKFFFLISLLLGYQGFCQEQRLYVSVSGSDDDPGTAQAPLASLKAAIAAVRSLQQKPEIIVGAGTHYLSETLVFKPEDSGTAQNPLIIRGRQGEMPIISGGQPLKLEWEEYKDGIYKAPTSGFVFDQLFVNGEKQIRARYPDFDENVSVFNGYAKDAISPERIKSWNDPIGGFLHAIHKHRWGGFHYQIAGVIGDSLVMEGGWQNNRQMGIHEEYRFVENIFEELDSPGEWYHDQSAGIIYYYPRSNVDLANALIEVPVLEGLMVFKGTEEQPVQYIHIDGLEFAHTLYTFMKTREPLLRSDWTIHRGGGLLYDGAENCGVSNSFFNRLGGNGVFISNYNRNVRISGCEFAFLGASGVAFVGSDEAVRSPSYEYHEFVPARDLDRIPGPKSNNYPSDCVVENCLIYNIGTVEKQVAGVQIAMASEITVNHNTIYNVPRSGINIGDGTWGGHHISFNDVFNTVLETGDHGAFNSWGRDRYWHPNRSVLDSLVAAEPSLIRLDAQKTTVIRNNRFHCDHCWDIDLDDGSSNYEIYNNVCLSGGIKLREGFYRKVYNNILYNSTFHPHVWFADSHDSFQHNILGTPYQPIQIDHWGDSIDYNLHPSQLSLEQARGLGIDQHGSFGDPQFRDVQSGDFRVSDDSPAVLLGFKNFPMEEFGVTGKTLKSKAVKFSMPKPVADYNLKDKDATVAWKGWILKQLVGLAEMSATGMPDEEGVLVLRREAGAKEEESSLQLNDVILGISLWNDRTEGGMNEVDDLAQFFLYYNQLHWANELAFTIFRNQKIQVVKVVR